MQMDGRVERSAIVLRPYQEDIINTIRSLMRRGIKRILLQSPTGSGKCLAPGTGVLMFNGTIKNVEDIRVGDRVMGPDSKARTVLALGSGFEEMFCVTPVKGDYYTVNKSHILSLKMTGGYFNDKREKHSIVNMSVEDYFCQTKYFRISAKGWRTGVDFDNGGAILPLPCWILGAWLGDGSSNGPSITTEDDAVSKEWCRFVEGIGMSVRVDDQGPENASKVFHAVADLGKIGGQQGKNAFTNTLRMLGVLNNKHIPLPYLPASPTHPP